MRAQACPTDEVKDAAIEDSEIEKLKINIHEKISNKVIELVKEKDLEMLKLHNKIAKMYTKARDLNKKLDGMKFQLSEKCREKTVLERDFKDYRQRKFEIISEKDSKIATMDSKIRNLEMGIKELEVELSRKCKCKENITLQKDFKKYKDESNKIISIKDMEIAEFYAKVRNLNMAVEELNHEASIKCKEKAIIEEDFNYFKEQSDRKNYENEQKIVKLKVKAKDRDKDVKDLNAQVSRTCKEKAFIEQNLKTFEEKSDVIISEKQSEIDHLKIKAKNLGDSLHELTVKLSIKCKEKALLEQDFKKYKEYGNEAISNKEQKISDLGMIVKKLDINLEALNIQFSKLEQEYVNQKEISERAISEKDLKIANLVMKANNLDKDDAKLKVQLSMKCNEITLLKKDLQKYKELSDEIISKYKAKIEKILADMHQKSQRQSEIFYLMKKSITGMAATHTDTFNQVVEDDKNNAVGNLVGCRLQELESFITILAREENTDIPRLSVKKNIFKNETFFASEILNGLDTQFVVPSSSDVVDQKSCEATVRKDGPHLKRKYAG